MLKAAKEYIFVLIKKTTVTATTTTRTLMMTTSTTTTTTTAATATTTNVIKSRMREKKIEICFSCEGNKMSSSKLVNHLTMIGLSGEERTRWRLHATNLWLSQTEHI